MNDDHNRLIARRAEQFANDAAAHFELDNMDALTREMARACLIYGWVSGRQAGGDEAKALVANYLRNLAGLEPDDTADDMKARNVDE